MGNLYPGTAVSGYNANPPPDDGTQVATNQITWAGIKSKVGDPLNTFAGAVDTNITSAFGKTLDGATVVPTAVNYPMTAADQGRLIKPTAAVTITTPDATVVGAPFTFAITNQSSGSVVLAGNGVQTVDGLATQNIGAGAGCIVKTDGANWFTFGLTPAQILNPGKPQGYLTLASSTTQVVPLSDVTSATSVFYTPYVGNVIPIYNGTNFVNFTFNQLTLTLAAQHLANTIYDVFVFSNAGTVTIGTGPAWTNSGAGTGARGSGAGTTQIGITNGLWTNTAQITARNGATTYTVAANQGTYVGSIFIDSVAGQISSTVTWGQSRKWGTWNAYNRLKIILQAGDTTASWTYSTNAFRAANNSTANSVTVFEGLSEENVTMLYQVSSVCSTGTTGALAGIGFNSTTVLSGTEGRNIGQTLTITGLYNVVPAIGINTVTAIESGNGTVTVTWQGTQPTMLLRAEWMG